MPDLGILDFCRECLAGVLGWFAAHVCSMFAREPKLGTIMAGVVPGGGPLPGDRPLTDTLGHRTLSRRNGSRVAMPGDDRDVPDSG
jgi:hypothetical protein